MTEASIKLTRRGHDVLAQIRTRALHDALRDKKRLLPTIEEALTALLIHVTGGHALMGDILARLVDREGDITVPPESQLVQLSCEFLARSLDVTPVHRHNTGMYSRGHYARAEWIGALMDADHWMPRLDTEEILAEMSGDELRTLAGTLPAHHGRPPAKVGELREWLVGKLPEWKPTSFHAAGIGRTPFRVMEEA